MTQTSYVWITFSWYCSYKYNKLNNDEVFWDKNCIVFLLIIVNSTLHFIYCFNTVNHVLEAVKRRDSKQKRYLLKGFLELNHISLWVTASSIFKAFLPSKARATNCTSQAGQDGIHRTALPLISSPSAANQTHHMAAFCLLTTARAKKLFFHQSGQNNNTGITGTFLCLSFSLFLIKFYLQNTGLNCSKQSLSPGSTSAFSLSPGQQCSCVYFSFYS